MSPRWRKLVGDVRVARRRFIGIAIAMSITMAAVTAILAGQSILDREMNRNFQGTVPPSAVLSMEAIDLALLEEIRSRPGIVAAERSVVFSAKTKLATGETVGVSLRVVPDFLKQDIAKVYAQEGAWSPAVGEVLIERAVRRMMPIELGNSFEFETPSGEQRSLRIAGTTHDPGEAPAWQERTIYGYITEQTLKQLDATRNFDQLNVVLNVQTVAEIESATRQLAMGLRERGHPVQFIRIPPPGEHPHQWQIDAISLTLLVFGVLAIVLEAALLAIVIGGLLAPQIRQIAVMKAIGARTRQIVGMYATLVLALASIALVIGMPIGLLAGHLLANFIADLLNFNVGNNAVPGWVFGVSAALGLGMPLFAAVWPIAAAAKRSVRESIDYYGVKSQGHDARWQTIFGRMRADNVGLNLALRNVSRRKAQFFMAMCLLVLTGSVFMLAGNLLSLWHTVTNTAIAEQRFDIQVILRAPQPEAEIAAAIKSVPGVKAVESAQVQWANLDEGDGLALSTRSLPLRLVPTDSKMQRLDIVEGQWLNPQDTGTVVLNSAARATLYPNVKIDDSIALVVNNKPMRFRVVGIARQMFSPAVGFVPQAVVSNGETIRKVRNVIVGLQSHVDADAAASSIEKALTDRQLPARGVYTKASANISTTMHTYIFTATMLLIVISVAKIATAGLASCMSTTIIERTREFGIMRTLGARSHDIQNSIVIEALLIGGTSWILALVLAVPITIVAGKVLSAVVSRPMPIVFSPAVAFLWLIGVALVAIVASVAPAKRAAGLTVRDTMTE